MATGGQKAGTISFGARTSIMWTKEGKTIPKKIRQKVL